MSIKYGAIGSPNARACAEAEKDVMRFRAESTAKTDEDPGWRALEAVIRQREVLAQTPTTCDSIFSPAPVKHDYDRLREVLTRAFNQAATGKGAVRHGQGKPFEEQPMQTLSRSLGTNAGLLYQAAKKAQESLRLESEAAVFELLGAINYLAGAIIYLEDEDVE